MNGIELRYTSAYIGSYNTPGNNVISGNDPYDGIYIWESTGTSIDGNRIGVNATGSGELPNAYGIHVEGGSAGINNNWIAYNSHYGVFFGPTASFGGGSWHNCFTSSHIAAVSNQNTSATALFPFNWWGSPTGPTSPGNPGGTGEKVYGLVDYGGFLTSPPAACRANALRF